MLFSRLLIWKQLPAVRAVLEVAAKILDLSLLETRQEPVFDPAHRLWFDLGFLEEGSERNGQFTPLIGIGPFQRPDPDTHSEVAADTEKSYGRTVPVIFSSARARSVVARHSGGVMFLHRIRPETRSSRS